jgi:hypothetical protein
MKSQPRQGTRQGRTRQVKTKQDKTGGEERTREDKKNKIRQDKIDVFVIVSVFCVYVFVIVTDVYCSLFMKPAHITPVMSGQEMIRHEYSQYACDQRGEGEQTKSYHYCLFLLFCCCTYFHH